MNTGRIPCEDEVRDQGDASTSQKTSKIASKPQEVRREARDRFFLEPSEETNPVDTWILWILWILGV